MEPKSFIKVMVALKIWASVTSNCKGHYWQMAHKSSSVSPEHEGPVAWRVRGGRGCSSCAQPVLAGLGQEPEEGDRDPPQDQKGGARLTLL